MLSISCIFVKVGGLPGSSALLMVSFLRKKNISSGFREEIFFSQHAHQKQNVPGLLESTLASKSKEIAIFFSL